MELKTYKYINNTKLLPGFDDGRIPTVNISNVAPIIPSINNLLPPLSFSGLNSMITGGTDWNTRFQPIQPIAPSVTINGPKTPAGISTRNFGKEANDYLKSQEDTSMLSAGASVIPATVGAVGDVIHAHKYEKTVDDLSAEAGYAQSSIGGIGYEYQNAIDKANEMREVRRQNTANTLKSTASGAAAGAAIGSIVPGIGTVAGGIVGGAAGLIGGLFGSKKRKRDAERAIRKLQLEAFNSREFNRSGALTTKLQLDEAEGKSYSVGKLPLDTAFGMMYGTPNARTEKGEWIVDGLSGSAHKVKRGAEDNALSFLRPQDAVLSRKNGGALYFERTGDLAGAIVVDKMNRGYNNYKEGKQPLPGFKNGLPGYWVPSLFGTVGSIYQYFDAANQSVKRPNAYRRNNYQNRALDILGGLNVNRLPILRLMRDAEARATLAINLSGATPSQKYMARVAQSANTQNAIGDLMLKINEQRNALKSQYANALLNSGQADRAAAMDASRWDLDYYSKAHAARQQGKQMGLYNFLNNLNQTYANAFKYNTYNKMYDLYNRELDKDQRKAYANMMLSLG